MPAKSHAWATALLRMVFLNQAPAGLALPSDLHQLFLSLHHEDPLPRGGQDQHEVVYPGYHRVVVDRGDKAWSVKDLPYPSARLQTPLEFPEAEGGNLVATHVGIGVEREGRGLLLYAAQASPTIQIIAGVVPRLTTDCTFTER